MFYKKEHFYRIFLIVITFSCINTTSYAQEKDTNKTLKTDAKPVSLKNYDTYLTIFNTYLESDDYDEAIKLSETYLKKESLAASQISAIELKIAKIYVKQNDYKNAYIHLENIRLNTKDANRFVNYSIVHNYYSDIKEYKKAFLILDEAYNFELKRGNQNKIITILLNIGTLNNETHNKEKALEYYNKSLKLSTELNNYEAMSMAYNNIVTIEIENKDYQAALEVLLKSKALLNKLKSNDEIKYSVDNNIASVYISLKNTDKAKPLLEAVKAYCYKTDNKRLLAYSLVTESEIYALDNYNNTKAIFILKDALLNAEKIKSISLIPEIHFRMSELHEKNRDFHLSLKSYKNYKQFNDSLIETLKANDIRALQTKFDVLQYKKNLKIQNQEIEILKIKSTKNKYLLILFGLLILLLIFFAYKQYKTLQIKKSNAIYITENNALKEEKLKQDVAFKKKQVTDFAIQIQEQNNFLLELKDNLKTATKKRTVDDLNKELKSISLDINSNIRLNNEKVQLNADIKESGEEFLMKLKDLYPDLKAKEVKVCTLIRLNYNTKQIAEQIGISEHSIHNYRYSIRKKLNLNKEEKLDEFLKKI